jgi:Asp-tRNA(Asn)/Glu-tRNA(Gln) amidotransferase A subunit family amidase
MTANAKSQIATRTVGLSMRECVALIQKGDLTSEQLVRDCLEIIDATDDELGAWAWLDRDDAIRQATAMDDLRRAGKPLGALHGIPVGIKDSIDVADVPTERGSEIYAGRIPDADAALVEKLREAGAVILGKTVTTEFAFMHPSKTRNPHNPEYGPGGSSSGSAAAVAAGHVPLAIGTQTNGSVIRPASFCGTYAFKPTTGVVSRRGVLQTSATLDQVGIFARDPGDLALLADVLKGYDATDVQSHLLPKPRMLEGFNAELPVEPKFAWIDMPYADRYTDTVREGFNELLDAMGGRVERLQAPQSFVALLECQRIINHYEMVRCLDSEYKNHGEKLSNTMKSALDEASTVTDVAYSEALEIRTAAIDWFENFFHDYDAIVTPAAPAEAPKYGTGTGDPVCCTIWTLCGLPCVSLPLLTGTDNMPIGVQLVGSTNDDERLLRTTRWFLDDLRAKTPEHEND